LANGQSGLKSGSIKQIQDEMKMIRRDLEDIKSMLVEEVTPTKDDVEAVEQGRREFARGEYVELKDLKAARKRAVS
jgi:hypothetical protein